MSEPRYTPGSQTSLREANRARLVDAVKRHGGLTQVELAGATGLSPATVSNIVKELAASGVLNTSPSTRSGRRAQHVTLAHANGLVVGVHFAARHMRILLADVASEILAEQRMPLALHHRADAELDKASMLVMDMLDSVDDKLSEVVAIGFAVSAPFDSVRGTVARSGMMRGWDGVDVADVLQRRLRVPVYVENAATLTALAEWRYGAGRGLKDTITLEIGQGIGAGLVLNGELYRGRHGLAGELGHVRVVPNGEICRCGRRGCLETVAGGQAIIASLEPTHGLLKVNDIVLRALGGDSECIRAIADAGHTIGLAVGDFCNLVDPERVIVDGELARAGELVLGPLRRGMESNLLGSASARPEVVAGQLGLRGAVMGAVAHAIDQSVQFGNVG